MSCTINDGYEIPCKDLGGLKDLWITNWNPNESTNAIAYDGKGVIDKLPAATYHLFALMLETASFTENVEINTENGTSYWRQSLSVVFYKINQDLLNMVEILVQGRFRIIFLDQNGEYRLFGLENPVRVIEASIQSGKLMSELNGATLTFSTLSERPAPTIEKQLAEDTLYPQQLEYRLILDPKNYFDLGPLTSPGGNYEATINQDSDFYSLYGTTGISFPDGNILVNQSKDRLDDPLNPTPGYSNSILDETGPIFFQGVIPFQSSTELMFVYTDDRNLAALPYNFLDSDGNKAINAPVGVYHPDGVVLASLCAGMQIAVVQSTGADVEIEIIRKHSPISANIPPGYEGLLNFLSITMNSSFDFPVIVDPGNPDRFTAVLTPGIYKARTQTTYRPSQAYPKSISEVVFEIY